MLTRREVFPWVLAVAGGSAAAAAPKPTDEAIVALERAMWTAYQQRRKEAFRAFLHPSYRSVSTDAVRLAIDEEALIDKITLKEVVFSKTVVAFPTDGMAVLTYDLKLDGSYLENEISGTYRSSSVWIPLQGEWKIVLHTEVVAV